MKLDAMRQQAGRPSGENVSQVGTQKRSDQQLAEQVGESRNQVQRYIRLTFLSTELLELVDRKKLHLNVGVTVSYLEEMQQIWLYELIRDMRCSLSLVQAEKNKWVDEENRVYIIFTISEIQEQLGCREQKACKLLKQLESCGLVEKNRLGLGRASILYVKNFIASQSLNCENHNPEQEQPPLSPDNSQDCTGNSIPASAGRQDLQHYSEQAQSNLQLLTCEYQSSGVVRITM